MVKELHIELENIVKKYDRVILDKVSLQLCNDSYVSIVGKSGAGKSTFMNILGLIEDYDGGKYSINGQLIRHGKDYSKLRKEYIGFIFQSYNLIPTLNCKENILLPQLYTKKKIENFDEIVENLGLSELLDKQVVYLSGGEKQRVGIARCLALNPSLIIADEPTGNLDKVNTEIVMKLLDNEHKKGRAIVVITHSDDVAKCAKKIYRLGNGKLNEDI